MGESCWRVDAERLTTNGEIRRRCSSSRGPGSDSGLLPSVGGVSHDCAGSTVKVSQLYPVVVDQGEIAGAYSRQRLAYQTANASEPDYPQASSRQVSLGAITPNTYCCDLASLLRWDRVECRMEGPTDPESDYTYTLRRLAFESARAYTVPGASAPRTVRARCEADYRKARAAEGRSSEPILLSFDVIEAHVLPAGTKVIVREC
ncbi:MAG TPA: hypothetical protein VNH82_09280 [Candidatus Dormibacteraeota bacterium]|nr:hypothetical protein [Candidatus Dormibacteraeota bacterium]